MFFNDGVYMIYFVAGRRLAFDFADCLLTNEQHTLIALFQYTYISICIALLFFRHAYSCSDRVAKLQWVFKHHTAQRFRKTERKKNEGKKLKKSSEASIFLFSRNIVYR